MFETKDSGKRMEFSSGMQRDTQEGKTLYHLVFDGPLFERWAQLLTRGAEKYSPGNWLKAEGQSELDRFKASAARHFIQWFRGDRDEDHAAAVTFNVNGAEYVQGKMSFPGDEAVDEQQALLPFPGLQEIMFGKGKLWEKTVAVYDKRQWSPEDAQAIAEAKDGEVVMVDMPDARPWVDLNKDTLDQLDEFHMAATARLFHYWGEPNQQMVNGLPFQWEAGLDEAEGFPSCPTVTVTAHHPEKRRKSGFCDFAEELEKKVWTMPVGYPGLMEPSVFPPPAPSIWKRVKAFVAKTLFALAFEIDGDAAVESYDKMIGGYYGEDEDEQGEWLDYEIPHARMGDSGFEGR